MKYIVNISYLNVEAAAAICRALQFHYGEPLMDRIAAEAEEPEDYEIELADPEEAEWLAMVVEDE